MLVIRAYTVLGELHLTVCSTAGDRVLSGVPVDSALGTASCRVRQGHAPQQVSQELRQLLEQIDGYAGDLWDHIEA